MFTLVQYFIIVIFIGPMTDCDRKVPAYALSLCLACVPMKGSSSPFSDVVSSFLPLSAF